MITSSCSRRRCLRFALIDRADADDLTPRVRSIQASLRVADTSQTELF